MKDNTMFQAKQEWLKKVMASDLNHATKVFAWAVFNRMFGDKIVSNPGGKTIEEDTGISSNKQGAHRKALQSTGAMTCVLIKNDKGSWDSYEYTLNLDWQGYTRDKGSPQEGKTLPPTGEEGTPQKGTGVPPTGETNLSNQSPKGTIKESLNDAKGAVRMEDKLFGHPCLTDGYDVPSLKKGVTYFLNSEGVTKVGNSEGSQNVSILLSDEAPAPSKPKGNRPAKVKVLGWSPDMAYFNKMVMKKKDPAKVAAARAIYEDPAFMPGRSAVERYVAAAQEVHNNKEAS